MKNVFIGLLIVAAGTGVFFFLRKKNNTTPKNEINKEWIFGSWKAVPDQATADSNLVPFRFDFKADGLLLRSAGDSVKKDTAYYAWTKTGSILLKKAASDTTGQELIVISLKTDSLQLKSGENNQTLFTKTR